MSRANHPGIVSRPATEVAASFPVDPEALALVRDDRDISANLDALIVVGRAPDAIRLLAHALRKPGAVAWACRCLRTIPLASASGPATEAIDAADRWAADPNESQRRAAETAAIAAGLGTPAGCLAMAAFWSGGSLAPAGLPEVPPGDAFTAKGVAGALLLAGVIADPEKAPRTYQRFLKLGLEVAEQPPRPMEVSTNPAAAVPTPPPRPTSPTPRLARRLDTWE